MDSYDSTEERFVQDYLKNLNVTMDNKINSMNEYRHAYINSTKKVLRYVKEHPIFSDEMEQKNLNMILLN